MHNDDNLKVVKRFFDEFANGKKLRIANDIFSDDIIAHDPANPQIQKGVEAQKQMANMYQTAFPDAHWEVNDMISAGDKVITRWTGTGTHKGVLQGNPPLPPTGKKVHVEGIWIHRLENGKIVESWNVWDTLGMLKQLGVVQEPERERMM